MQPTVRLAGRPRPVRREQRRDGLPDQGRDQRRGFVVRVLTVGSAPPRQGVGQRLGVPFGGAYGVACGGVGDGEGAQGGPACGVRRSGGGQGPFPAADGLGEVAGVPLGDAEVVLGASATARQASRAAASSSGGRARSRAAPASVVAATQSGSWAVPGSTWSGPYASSQAVSAPAGSGTCSSWVRARPAWISA